MKTKIRRLEIEHVAIFILVLILVLVLAPLVIQFASQSKIVVSTSGPTPIATFCSRQHWDDYKQAIVVDCYP